MPSASLPKFPSASCATAAQVPFSLTASLGSHCTLGLGLHLSLPPCPFSGTFVHPPCYGMPYPSHLLFQPSVLLRQGFPSILSSTRRDLSIFFFFILNIHWQQALESMSTLSHLPACPHVSQQCQIQGHLWRWGAMWHRDVPALSADANTAPAPRE